MRVSTAVSPSMGASFLNLRYNPGMNMDALPVIDLSAPDQGELGQACREVGFFYVVHHGVPEATRKAMFAAAREFFSQPVAFKQQYSIKLSPHNRGYVALEGERLNLTADHKEAFNIGLEIAADHPD